MNYIAYYRVSTKKQGQSGLGLEAQQASLQSFIKKGEDTIIAEFTDIESGKKSDRPNLKAAIKMALETDATLLIAKLDRLSRKAAFTFTLMEESKVKFVCADMPNTNNLTIGITALLAQDEGERISQRTKAALKAKKDRGEIWGPISVSREELMRRNRVHRVYNKPDAEKVNTLKMLKSSGADMGKLKEVSQQIFGRPLAQSTIYKYLSL